MKKTLCLLLLVCALPIGANAQIIGAAYATDIQAYVDHWLVPSYNIDGYTAVLVRDLENFGFTVLWDEAQKTVSFYRDFAKPLTPKVPVYENRPVGTKLYDVYQTDIRTFFRGTEIPSYNIGGRTAVRLRDIAMVGEASFDAARRSANVFCREAEYFEDEIDYIKTIFYGKMLLLSRADLALEPLVAMVQSGICDEQTIATYRTFYTQMLADMEAYKAYKEPYGFTESSQELWWAIVNMRYAGETALIMAEQVRQGADITASMGYYTQYMSDSQLQRQVALFKLDEEMQTLTLFWG